MFLRIQLNAYIYTIGHIHFIVSKKTYGGCREVVEIHKVTFNPNSSRVSEDFK